MVRVPDITKSCDPSLPRSEAETAADADGERLVVAISSRALFDLQESHALFEREGLDSYRRFQIARENDIHDPGIAFPLVEKLLRLNQVSENTPQVEVICQPRA